MTVAAMCAAGRNVFGRRTCAQGEAPPVFDAVEHALDDVSGFVEFGVVLELYLAFPARRDTGFGLGFPKPVAQAFGIVATICDHSCAFAHIWLKALTRLGDIGAIARGQMSMNRATLAVAYRMRPGVQPAFGLADGAPVTLVFLTPLAAMRCVSM